jgi:hypothetical protein
MFRYRYFMTGGQVGTGYITFYAAGSTTLAAWITAATTFIQSAWGTGAGGGLPSGVTIQGDGVIDELDPATGDLTGSQAVTPPGVISGAGTGTYAAPTGACVSWLTSGFVNGRRLRGRTFIVPVVSSKFQSDGTLDATFLSQIRTAANIYAGGAYIPVVWHRPVNGAGGEQHAINGYSVTDQAAVLTARR